LAAADARRGDAAAVAAAKTDFGRRLSPEFRDETDEPRLLGGGVVVADRVRHDRRWEPPRPGSRPASFPSAAWRRECRR